MSYDLFFTSKSPVSAKELARYFKGRPNYEVSKVQIPNISVKELMVKKPKCIYGRRSISEAAAMMKRKDYGQLPVIDSEDKLVAMIYELDAVASLLR